MNRVVLLLVLAVATTAPAQEKPQAPAPAPSPSPSPGETPTFPAEVEQVTVDVVVIDKKGGPVSNLTQADFNVFEDDVPQTIASFEAIQVPAAPSATPAPRPRVSINTAPELRTGRTFVVVFDDIHLTPFQASRAKNAVAELLKTGVREGDRVTLVATGGGAWWNTRMEAGREELIAMLKRLEGRHIPDISPERMSDYEAMRIHVFHDSQVEQRVARRFETYGVSQRSRADQEQSQYYDGDPLVRGRASEVYYQAVARNRITLEVIERLLLSLGTTKGRKQMILVSEGFIYDPNLDDFKRVVQASRRSNCAIYFLDTRGLGGLSTYASAEFGPPIDTRDLGATFSESIEASEGAESIAADTGGFTVKNTNDLGKGIQRIADESRSYYLLGYNSTNTKRDGRFRKIQVKLARKGLQLRARKGYYAPLDAAQTAQAEKKKKPGPDADIQAALDSPYIEDDIPIRVTAYVFEETLLGKASVLMAGEVDVRGFAFEEQEGRLLDALEFLLVVAHRETGEYFRYDQKIEMKLLPETRDRLGRSWFPILRNFELAPGGYQAKLVVRDKNSRQIGTVIHEFEVPDLTLFRVSTPVLSDTLQPNPDPEDKHPKPAVVARRTFPPGATLFCSYEVFGAAKDPKTGMPRVVAGYQIRRSDGVAVAGMQPTMINPTSLGKLSRLTGTKLESAKPGDYEFVLSLKDELSGQTLEVREPFTIAGAS